MPRVIVKTSTVMNPEYLEIHAKLGSFLLVGHVEQQNLKLLRNQPGVTKVRVEKWLKTYFKR